MMVTHTSALTPSSATVATSNTAVAAPTYNPPNRSRRACLLTIIITEAVYRARFPLFLLVSSCRVDTLGKRRYPPALPARYVGYLLHHKMPRRRMDLWD